MVSSLPIGVIYGYTLLIDVIKTSSKTINPRMFYSFCWTRFLIRVQDETEPTQSTVD